jgi:hypothetical protein
MDNLIKFLLTEWAGAPLVIWILGVVVILMLIVLRFALRVPTTFRAITRKGKKVREIVIFTEPATQMKTKQAH